MVLGLVALPFASLCADEGASFLKIGVGARAAGLGAAQTAVADDASAIYWNPAGLSGIGKSELAAHHAELFADTRYDFLAMSRPTRIGTIGAGFGYLSQGAIEGRDENRNPTGNFTASDAVFGLALARRVSTSVQAGIGLKAIQSRIAGDSASTAALDIGAIWKASPMSVGVAVQNLGPGLKFVNERSQLPLTFAGGVALRLPLGLALAADARYRPYSRSQEYGIGTEYGGLGAITFRAGWLGARTQGGTASKARSVIPVGFAAGIGLRFSSFNLDYSFVPFGELGNAQRISLSSRF